MLDENENARLLTRFEAGTNKRATLKAFKRRNTNEMHAFLLTGAEQLV